MSAILLDQLPDEIKSKSLPELLLGYQGRLLESTAIYPVVLYEKSRRIGVTWAVAADAVLTAGAARSAGGMDVMYIGYNLDMAREFIDTAAMWAKAFMPALAEVQEFLFHDTDDKGVEKHIQAFRIRFASGFEIVALTSKPRSLRGRQGYLIFDEAAFHDDLAGMMKAALAFLIWGGKVLVISTHDGDQNAFNELIQEARKGRTPYKVLRTTFDDAIEDGLYERVKLMMEARGQTVKPKAEWIADIYAYYGDDADEELRVIPAEGSGTAIAGALIEKAMVDGPVVLRLERPARFVHEPLHIREAEIADWLDAEVKPLLAALDPRQQHFFGEDFGRVADLSVVWPIAMLGNTVRHTPFVVEMRNIHFAQQRQVLFYILDRLPRFIRGAMDAGGNGAQLAEEAADRYGHERIVQVKFTTEWYRENMPGFVAAFEDGMVQLPRDAEILRDHRQLKKIGGVVQLPKAKNLDKQGKPRHGDTAIAHALGWHATVTDIPAYGYDTVTGRPRDRFEGGRPDDDREYREHADDADRGGIGRMKGAW